MNIYNTLQFILNHPLARKKKWQAFKRILNWQLGVRLLPFPIIYPFAGNCKLIVGKGMTGATGNIYCGLHDFEEMGFTLHFLRPDDLFADIGANIGSYAVLASGVIGATSLSFEPVPSTYAHLKDNIYINRLENKVHALNIGLGNTPGKLNFSTELDTVNHVLTNNEVCKTSVEVPVRMFDDYCTDIVPSLIKIDVEGFEYQVLKGATTTLQNSQLKAIIIELNGSGNRYGIDDTTIHQFLSSYNFKPFDQTL